MDVSYLYNPKAIELWNKSNEGERERQGGRKRKN